MVLGAKWGSPSGEGLGGAAGRQAAHCASGGRAEGGCGPVAHGVGERLRPRTSVTACTRVRVTHTHTRREAGSGMEAGSFGLYLILRFDFRFV